MGGESYNLVSALQERGTTVKEMLKTLNNRWGDPLREQTAYQDYHRLKQSYKPFREFIGDFQTYATEAKISESQQLRDLRFKLSYEMQQAVANHMPEELDSFITHLHVIAANLEAAQAARNRSSSNRNHGGSAASSFPSRQPAPTTTNQTQRITPAGPAPAARNEWVPRGTCAKCLQTGHAYRNCTNPGMGDWQKRCSDIELRAVARRNAVNEVGQPAGPEGDDSGNA